MAETAASADMSTICGQRSLEQQLLVVDEGEGDEEARDAQAEGLDPGGEHVGARDVGGREGGDRVGRREIGQHRVVEDEEVRGQQAHPEIAHRRRAHRDRDHVGRGGRDAGAEHGHHEEDSTIATSRMPPAIWTTTPPKASAAPVRVSTPTIMPEPASATAMVAAENEASVSASQHRRGVIHVCRSRKESAKVTTIV